MKTYKHLYPQIASFPALYRAWRKARRGKRYQPTPAAFEYHLDGELLALHQALENESWQPGGYRSFTIHEPKRRKISAAPFADRVVHHALVQVLEPMTRKRAVNYIHLDQDSLPRPCQKSEIRGQKPEIRAILKSGQAENPDGRTSNAGGS